MHSRNLRIFLLKNVKVFFGCLGSPIKEKTKTLNKKPSHHTSTPSLQQAGFKEVQKEQGVCIFSSVTQGNAAKVVFRFISSSQGPFYLVWGEVRSVRSRWMGHQTQARFSPPLTQEQLQRVESGRHHFCSRTVQLVHACTAQTSLVPKPALHLIPDPLLLMTTFLIRETKHKTLHLSPKPGLQHLSQPSP